MVHGALIFDSILPTRSKSRHAFFLQIYGSGSGPLEASDDGVALAIFNDDGGGVQWHSGSKDSSGGDGVGGGSSSNRRISAGVPGAVARRQRCGSALSARVWLNSHRIGHYL
jgi:hypothetical protein